MPQRMMPPKSYTHNQWKQKFDALTNEIENIQQRLPATTNGNTELKLDEDLSHLYNLIAKKNELATNDDHYDFYFQPHVLYTRLTKSIRQLFYQYDIAHPINQRALVRFHMVEMNELIDKLDVSQKHLVANKETLVFFQRNYELLTSQLATMTNELYCQEKGLFNKLLLLVNQYHIALPKIDYQTPPALSSEELATLEMKEKRIYEHTRNVLTDQLASLPESMKKVKLKTADLITKIEYNRTRNDETNCFFKRNSFDYKRHTINLSMTASLLKTPKDQAIHQDYKKLADKNPTSDHNKYFMLTILGLVLYAVALFVTLPPAAILTLGLLGTGMAVFGSTVYQRSSHTRTGDLLAATQIEVVASCQNKQKL